MSGATAGPAASSTSIAATASTVVRAAGEVDLETADALAAALRTATAGSEDAVVLDLIGVPFMDSSGLQVLFVASRQLGDRLVAGLEQRLAGRPPARARRGSRSVPGLAERRGRDPRRRGLTMARGA